MDRNLSVMCVSVLALVLQQVYSQDHCMRITVDDLGRFDMLSRDGILSSILTPTGEASPYTFVRILNMTIVCEAQHMMQDRYRYTSVVVSFNCLTTDDRVPECANSSVVNKEQFDFGCVSGAWSPNILTVSTAARTTNPTATLSTALDTDCILCINPNNAEARFLSSPVDSVTHCVGCSNCPFGLQRCYYQPRTTIEVCCIYFYEGVCVTECPTPLDANPHNELECEFHCGELSDANGSFNYTNGQLSGSVATLTCNDDYEASNSSATCGPTREWSSIPVCTTIECEPLPMIASGVITYAPDSISNYSLGTTATYSCYTGFSLNLSAGSETRTCVDDGNDDAEGVFDLQAPTCVPIKCDAVNSLAHGEVIYSKVDRRVNSVVTYLCDTGFLLEGPSVRTCTATKSWNPDVNPSCTLSGIAIALIILGIVALLLFICTSIGIGVRLYFNRRSRTMPSENQEHGVHGHNASLPPDAEYDTIHYVQQTDPGLQVEVIGTESSTTVGALTHCGTSAAAIRPEVNGVILQFPDSMRIPASHLQLASYPIGQGETGIIYKGQLFDWNNEPIQEVAEKTLKGLFSSMDIQSLFSESITMKDFQHPNVMPLIGICLDAGPGVSMVIPYMANGSLLDYLKRERANIVLDIQTTQKLLLKICYQIALGMEYLAQEKFTHRDLAARNCLLDDNGNIKVGDFGLAEDIYVKGYFRQGDKTSVKLPYKWMSIESLNDAIFSEKSDVWSYGVTVWEVFSGGRTPYPGMDPLSLIQLLGEERRLGIPHNAACSTPIVTEMQKCWLSNPDDRPTFSELSSTMEDTLRQTAISDHCEVKVDLTHTEDESTGYSDFSSLSSRLHSQMAGSEPVDLGDYENLNAVAVSADENIGQEVGDHTENASYDASQMNPPMKEARFTCQYEDFSTLRSRISAENSSDRLDDSVTAAMISTEQNIAYSICEGTTNIQNVSCDTY